MTTFATEKRRPNKNPTQFYDGIWRLKHRGQGQLGHGGEGVRCHLVLIGVVHTAAGAPPTSPAAAAAATTPFTTYAVSRPSPSSTTMEDVLDSLLGLPPPSRSPSPSPATASTSTTAASAASAATSSHQVPTSTLRSCADIRPDQDPAGSASVGSYPNPSGRGDRDVDVDLDDADQLEPAGWEAADLAGFEPTPRVTSRHPVEPPGLPGPPGWDVPPVTAPAGWRGTAVVGVVVEEAAEGQYCEEAEFGAALISMPLDALDPVRGMTASEIPRRRRSESNASEDADAQFRSRQKGRRPRRVSFDLSAAGGGAGGALDGEPGAVACRRVGCSRVAPEAAARLRFKTCHNCAHTYCSRECRREHWDSHKRACAVQRVGGLLRRVVAKVRGDTAAVSATARRGYAAHGRGVVRLLFHSTDAAEAYCAGEVAAGATGQGQELVFVRWADLPAGELGGSLHEDLTRLCNTYNPRTRAVTLVVLEVLSEAPSDDGVVMWERQLVSRVFKVHLFREEHVEKTLVLEGVLAKDVAARSAVLRNVMRTLGQQGVDLRDEAHAEVFTRVKEYVEQGQQGLDNAPALHVDLHLHSGVRIAVILVPESASDLLDVNMETVDVGVKE